MVNIDAGDDGRNARADPACIVDGGVDDHAVHRLALILDRVVARANVGRRQIRPARDRLKDDEA